jgi:LysR family glycine cleavage system transcriptional activator
MKEELIPVCSPSFKKKHRIKSASSVLRAPMIHLSMRPDGWEQWFSSQGVEYENLTGMMIDQFQTALIAARESIGIALVPKFMCEEAIRSGEVIYPFDSTVETAGAYSLTWPNDSNNIITLERFHDWLLSEIN